MVELDRALRALNVVLARCKPTALPQAPALEAAARALEEAAERTCDDDSSVCEAAVSQLALLALHLVGLEAKLRRAALSPRCPLEVAAAVATSALRAWRQALLLCKLGWPATSGLVQSLVRCAPLLIDGGRRMLARLHTNRVLGRRPGADLTALYLAHLQAGQALLTCTLLQGDNAELDHSMAAATVGALDPLDTAAWLALLCDVSASERTDLPLDVHGRIGHLMECLLVPGGPTNFAAVQAAVAADASMSRSVAAAMLSGFKASLAALSAPEDAQPSSSHGAAAGTGSEEDARDPGLAVALLQCGLELLQVPCLREAVRQLLDQPARHAVLQAAVERLVSVPADGLRFTEWQAAMQVWVWLAIAARQSVQPGPRRASLQALGFRLLHRVAPIVRQEPQEASLGKNHRGALPCCMLLQQCMALQPPEAACRPASELESVLRGTDAAARLLPVFLARVPAGGGQMPQPPPRQPTPQQPQQQRLNSPGGCERHVCADAAAACLEAARFGCVAAMSFMGSNPFGRIPPQQLAPVAAAAQQFAATCCRLLHYGLGCTAEQRAMLPELGDPLWLHSRAVHAVTVHRDLVREIAERLPDVAQWQAAMRSLDSAELALCEASAAAFEAAGPLDKLHAPDGPQVVATELALVAACASDWLLAARPELLQRMLNACRLALHDTSQPEEWLATATTVASAASEGHRAAVALLRSGLLDGMLTIPWPALASNQVNVAENALFTCFSCLCEATWQAWKRCEAAGLQATAEGRCLNQAEEQLLVLAEQAQSLFGDPAKRGTLLRDPLVAQLLADAKEAAAALQRWWCLEAEALTLEQLPQLELAKAASKRACAYLRCANLGGEGGPGAGQGVGSKKCSACRAVWYCGTACSHADWRQGGHRRTCKLLAAERAARKEQAGAPAAAAEPQ